MRLYELIVEDENVDGIFAISLVHDPAIESNGVFFDKQQLMFAEVNREERLFMSPVLIPNKYILRVDAEGIPYHVFFKPETVKRLSQMYLENKYTDKATLEHEKPIDGVHLVESWIVESAEKDKSKLYGLNVPTGTWMGTFRITNDKIWEEYVKTGKVKGFSIEGLFEHKLSEPINKGDLLFSKEVSELTEEESEVVLTKIKALIKKDKRYSSKKRVEMESYSDYPEGVKNNAKKAVEWAEKNGWGSCGTPVGKVRASQLSKGEPISVETIKRMYSYLSRHEGDLESSTSFGEGCGYLMYQSWGGKAALGWSRNKLRELGLLQEETKLKSIKDLTEQEAKDLLEVIHSLLMPEVELQEPSITSTYPGEVASGSISPETL